MITATLVLTAVMTWYGGPFIGEHHAAYWHNEVPPGAPDVVGFQYPGVAACDSYAFGDVLRFEGNGRIAYGVVLDRRARHDSEYCGYFDAWLALAKQLGYGPLFDGADAGAVGVEVTRLSNRRDERWQRYH